MFVLPAKGSIEKHFIYESSFRIDSTDRGMVLLPDVIYESSARMLLRSWGSDEGGMNKARLSIGQRNRRFQSESSDQNQKFTDSIEDRLETCTYIFVINEKRIAKCSFVRSETCVNVYLRNKNEKRIAKCSFVQQKRATFVIRTRKE